MKKLALFLMLALASNLFAFEKNSLTKAFQKPPDSVKPWVYWYWYSDNISKEGITKDLQAMSRIGIGTAFIGNVANSGEVGKVKALSNEWWAMVRHAIREAGRYGINIGMFNCPGWSQSGGPWIKPDQAMRYLVTNETKVSGPKAFREKLAAPDGTFQDVAVLAFPAPAFDGLYLDHAIAKIASHPASKNLANLIDHDRSTIFQFPEKAITDNSFTLDIETDSPFKAQSLSIYPSPVQYSVKCELYVENKSGEFKTVKKVELFRPPKNFDVGPMYNAPTTVSFPLVASKHFRLVFSNFAFHPFIGKFTGIPGIAELELSESAKLDHYIEKQLGKMFWMPLPMWDAYLWAKPDEPASAGMMIPEKKIKDITKHLHADGVLDWQVPAGGWIIQRVSMIPTGAKNSPVLPEGQGFEVDKMSRKLAAYHFNAYIGKVLRDMPAAERKALKYVVIDSYEKGPQNWTDGMRVDFEKKYGYDPLKWFPVLSGRIVGSAQESDRFLWDLRRMVADKISHEYVAGLREMANKNGLKLWLENYGHWGYPGEFLQYGGQADIVSGEFWATGVLGSIEQKAASSAAHIYGQKLTCAESFTSGAPNFVYHPWAFKKRGDWSFTQGINQTLLHVYLHQAYDDRIPGVNAWFGSAFNRHNTWFYEIDSWLTYIKRCNFLLQQGKYVADVAYFIGEDAPKMTGIQQPPLPAGYSFDYINAEVIMNRLQVRDGKYLLPDGMSYSLLVLPELETMRPELLAKIKELVKQGGAIYGPRPLRSPSLQNHPKCDDIVRTLTTEMWQDCNGKGASHAVFGKGNIYYGQDLQNVLNELKTPPDVNLENADSVLWIHRRLADQDIYFVANQADEEINFSPVFRVQNKIPELWDAVSGKMLPAAIYAQTDNGVKTELNLNARESVFVVFRKEMQDRAAVREILRDDKKINLDEATLDDDGFKALVRENGIYRIVFADGREKEFKVGDIPPVLKIKGPWQVNFTPGMDAPEQTTFPALKSWTESDLEGIKYYSGTAVYRKTFALPPSFFKKDRRVILDLGDVGVIAKVTLNGRQYGDFWQHPFEIDITDAAKPGANDLEIKATNVWRNRIIGDAKYPDSFPSSGGKPKQFKTSLLTDIGLKGDEALMPSGLMGPVKIIIAKLIRED